MMYIDFHIHYVPTAKDVVAVVVGRDTWGIHPWRADEDFGEPDLSGKIAIGECGLDFTREVSKERQLKLLTTHVKLSETTGLPLILHCVKALDQLLQLRRELRPVVPWMLHGFRGKPQQLRSLLDAGFFVSFGFRYNEESLRLCPTERLMLETDDDETHPISEIYNNVANLRGVKVPNLCEAMAENYLAFFQKKPLLI